MHPATRPATSMPDTSSGRSMPNGGGPPRCTGRPVPSTSRRCAATSTPSRNAEHEPTKAGDGRVGLYAGFCPRAPRGLPMGGHPSRPAVAGRLQRSTRGLGRAALERLRRTAANRLPFDLAPGGVYLATPVTRCAVVSYTAVSPLPARSAGGLLSVALSRGSPRVAVNDHPALWSPDVPRRRGLPRRRDRPADSSVVPVTLALHDPAGAVDTPTGGASACTQTMINSTTRCVSPSRA